MLVVYTTANNWDNKVVAYIYPSIERTCYFACPHIKNCKLFITKSYSNIPPNFQHAQNQPIHFQVYSRYQTLPPKKIVYEKLHKTCIPKTLFATTRDWDIDHIYISTNCENTPSETNAITIFGPTCTLKSFIPTSPLHQNPWSTPLPNT